MSFIGIISERKCLENIKPHISKIEDINIIHINSKSIENIKNIKFETIIIDSDINKLEKQSNVLEKIFLNAKYLLVNTDVNIKFDIKNIEKTKIITYGLNRKAIVTVSSISDQYILVCLQKELINKENIKQEVGEKRIKIDSKNKLKIYEILLIYIIYMINNHEIIEII